MKGEAFCSYWNRHYEYSVFPTHTTSAKVTIRGLPECCVHRHGVPHSTAPVQRIHFTPMNCYSGPMMTEIIGIAKFFTTLKQLVCQKGEMDF